MSAARGQIIGNISTASGFLVGVRTNTWAVAVGVENVYVESAANAVAPNQWVFVAAAYDGTLTTNNVKMYVSTDGLTLTDLGTFTINQGTVATNAVNPVRIGQNAKGYYDNVRLYGATNSTGVLSKSGIEIWMKTLDTGGS